MYKVHAVVARSLLEQVRLAICLARQLIVENKCKDIAIAAIDSDPMASICHGLGYNFTDIHNNDDNSPGTEILIIKPEDIPLMQCNAIIAMCPINHKMLLNMRASMNVILTGKHTEDFLYYDTLHNMEVTYVPPQSHIITRDVSITSMKSRELMLLLKKEYSAFYASNVLGVNTYNSRFNHDFILHENRNMFDALAKYICSRQEHKDKTSALEYLMACYMERIDDNLGPILGAQFKNLAKYLIELDFKARGEVLYGHENNGTLRGIPISKDLCHRLELNNDQAKIWRFHFGAISDTPHIQSKNAALINAIMLQDIGFNVSAVYILHHDGRSIYESRLQDSDINKVRGNIEKVIDEVLANGMPIDCTAI